MVWAPRRSALLRYSTAEIHVANATLDDSSTWMLTGDSYVTEFNGDAANVISNGFTLYVNGVALTGTK